MNSGSVLLLVDVQANMFDPASPVAGAAPLLGRLRDLLHRARGAGVPVVFVRNCGGAGDPDVPGSPGWQLHAELAPGDGELILDKTTCNTFASTELAAVLESSRLTHLVIAGLQSEYCIRETTLGALEMGYGGALASDGHSTYDSRDRKAATIVAAVNDELSSRVTLVPAEKISFVEQRTFRT